mmetsp:Transcript_21051/g.29209  ORF Transcript_21051/g.29209 Transcript_21051/m.29209 type:complete len:82 (-) Transcript_21051:1058-1303(-)
MMVFIILAIASAAVVLLEFSAKRATPDFIAMMVEINLLVERVDIALVDVAAVVVPFVQLEAIVRRPLPRLRWHVLQALTVL